jgi:hypothetical protein
MLKEIYPPTLPSDSIPVREDMLSVFGDGRSYMHDYKFYYNYFGKIPNGKEISRIDLKKAIEWFSQHYHNEIKATFFQQDYDYRRKGFAPTERFFVLHNQTLVTFNDGDMCRVLDHDLNENRFDAIIAQVRVFRKKPKPLATSWGLVVLHSLSGIHFLPFPVLFFQPV